MPVTIPDKLPASAIAGSAEDHVPPPVLLSVAAAPSQAVTLPEIATGRGLTVMMVVVKQPSGNVYVIDDEPAVMPLTMPDVVPTTATAGVPDDHRPPALVSVIDCPMHTAAGPVVAAGAASTDTVL